MFVRDQLPALVRLRRAVTPRLTGAAERLMAERDERCDRPAARREARVEAGSALAMLVIAIALPVAFDAPAPAALVTVALVVAVAIASRVEFYVGAGFAMAVQIVFVPALFVIDAAWAPLVVAAGLVLGRLWEVAHDRNLKRHVLVGIGNAWFAIGPAIVLAAAGADDPAWGDWRLYVLALATQFVGDTVAGMAREWLVLRVPPRLQLRLIGLVYLVDLMLTPIGFLAALEAQDEPLAFLLVLPLAALLRIFASERSARIDQAIELSTAYRGTAFLLGEVIADDDEYTGEHSYGVIALSLEIADELGLDEDDRRTVEFGALLHDVGKIAVPKEIINKPGPLTDGEWLVMREHTVAGQRMLDRVGGSMADVGRIVRASHERWDGGGYPDGTAGEDIPLPARIVTVADAFSAITTTRAYRPAQSTEAAVLELRRCAGTQFDPAVVRALIAVLNRSPSQSPRGLAARPSDARADAPASAAYSSAAPPS